MPSADTPPIHFDGNEQARSPHARRMSDQIERERRLALACSGAEYCESRFFNASHDLIESRKWRFNETGRTSLFSEPFAQLVDEKNAVYGSRFALSAAYFANPFRKTGGNFPRISIYRVASFA